MGTMVPYNKLPYGIEASSSSGWSDCSCSGVEVFLAWGTWASRILYWQDVKSLHSDYRSDRVRVVQL